MVFLKVFETAFMQSKGDMKMWRSHAEASIMKSVALTAIAGFFLISNAHSLDLSGTVFHQVGLEKNIDPNLLYAVALAESAYSPLKGAKGAAPYPWTLRLPNKPIYARSRQQAKQELQKILLNTSTVDVGLMQVNVRWHKHRVNRPEDLLDPLTNVRVAADILLENFKRSPDNLVTALGNYHSNVANRRNQYGLTVLYIYENLKKSINKLPPSTNVYPTAKLPRDAR